MAILEEAVSEDRRISLEEAHRLVLESGLRTPSEAVDIVRADRDAR